MAATLVQQDTVLAMVTEPRKIPPDKLTELNKNLLQLEGVEPKEETAHLEDDLWRQLGIRDEKYST